jgi:DNA mismatch repair protein MutL
MVKMVKYSDNVFRRKILMNIKRIAKLPIQLINRIAAGEVVERPSSALKELIENSIDANASKITVNLIQGGIKLIQVIDDGVGIHGDDIELTIEQHATSKIQIEEDLYNINTLGFRGEGLASIASISNLVLSSKIATNNCGYTINSNFGVVAKVKPIAINNGTSIEVKDIFHNIPARKRFLKSDVTEYGHCKAVFERIALSFPEISFELTNNDKVIYKLEKQSLLDRIGLIFGDDYSHHYFEILELGHANLSGYLFHPSYLSGNKTVQYFYVNKRFVKDRVIQNAIKQGFSGVIHHEHQPQYILFLEINHQDVDVNVHPTKAEVRFKDSSLIHSLISGAVRKALGSKVQNNNTIINDTPVINNMNYQRDDSANNKHFNNYKGQNNYIPPQLIKEWLPNNNYSHDLVKAKEVRHQEQLNISSTVEHYLGYAIAQLNGVYILSQVSDGLIVVDMHAAHERILLEKMKNQVQNSEIITHELLVAIEINIDERLYAAILNHHNELVKLGFKFKLEGESKIILLGIPALIHTANMEKLFIAVVNQLEEYGNSNVLENYQEKILGTIACHNAVRANEKLGIEEMNSLLREMETVSRSDYCNHGRPTWFKLTMQQLDNMFMRGK